MRMPVIVAVLSLTSVWTAPVFSQDVERSSPASSFEVLGPGLAEGQEVRVSDLFGRTSRGRVVSVSGSRLVVTRSRGIFRSSVTQTFAEDSVATIDAVDPTWNGALIVGVASALVLGLWARSCETGECVQGRAMYAVLGTGIGLGVGGAVDRLRNRRVYMRPSMPTSGAAVSVALGRDGIGVRARLQA